MELGARLIDAMLSELGTACAPPAIGFDRPRTRDPAIIAIFGAGARL